MKQSKDAQIVELKQKIETLSGTNIQLEKALQACNTAKDSWYKRAGEKDDELKALHDLLDVLPDAVPRKTGTDDTPSYERQERSVMERLLAYLVRRG